MIPCGRKCRFVFEQVLTFCEGGFSLWPGIKPALNWKQVPKKNQGFIEKRTLCFGFEILESEVWASIYFEYSVYNIGLLLLIILCFLINCAVYKASGSVERYYPELQISCFVQPAV